MSESAMDFGNNDQATSQVGESPEGPELTYSDSEEQSGNPNPAWAEYLNDIPDGYKGIVGDAFKRWDSRVGNKFHEIHKQYEPYKRYENLVKNQVDPAIAEAGIALFQRLQTDPQGFYQQLGEHFGLSAEQAQAAVEGENDSDEDEDEQPYEDPRIAQIERQNQQIMALYQQQEQARIQEQADQQVDMELAQFREAHPEVTDADMTPILRIALMGTQQNPNFSFEDAFQTYSKEINARMQSRPGNSAPKVIPPNGQPGSQPMPNFADLSDEERKKIMVEELRRASNS